MSEFVDAEIDGYRLGPVLGQGAAAVVHRAEALEPDGERPPVVACKLLHPTAAEQPNVVASFRFERRVLSRLDHPAFPRVHGIGSAAGTLYLLQDLVDGVALDRYLMRNRPDLAESLDLLGQLAGALDHLHGAGYVHRDVKPGNIVRTPAARMMLVDFGTVVRADEPTGYEIGVYGTVSYLAPEQAEPGADVGVGADLYALGALAYRLLTGHRHFDGTREDVLDGLRHRTPTPPSQRARIAPAFDPVLGRALARQPADRYPSGAELVDALRAAAEEPAPTRWSRLRSRVRPGT